MSPRECIQCGDFVLKGGNLHGRCVVEYHAWLQSDVTTFRVEVRTPGDTETGWLAWWNAASDVEAALRETRRVAQGFDARTVRSDGEVLVSIAGGRRGDTSTTRRAQWDAK